MRVLLSTLLFSALLGLAGCEPQGPANDIGDNIDQVNKAGSSQSEPASRVREEAAPPEAEVIEQQKEEIDSEVEGASQEAEERLNEIMEDTLEQAPQ